MTTDQLNTGLLQMTNRVYGTRNYQIPRAIYLLLLAVVTRTVQVVPGQPNLPPLDFSVLSLDDAIAGIRLLGQPTNGHKLLIPAPVVRMLVALLYRTARGDNGQVLVGTYSPGVASPPPPASSN